MTALAWAAIAAAILLVPATSELPRRLTALTAGGRLAATSVAPPRRRIEWSPLGASGPVTLAAVVAGVVGATRGVALAVAALVVTATAGHVGRSVLARRRAASDRDDLIVALRLLVAELEAGARPGAALRAVASAAPRQASHLSALAEAVETGRGWPNIDGSAPVAGRLTQAWRVSERSGAPVADVVARLVADLDDARERDRQLAAALAGPRSSAALLAGLPVVGVDLGAAMGADPIHVLIDTTAGRIVCAIGAVLDTVGVVWTMRIAVAAERG